MPASSRLAASPSAVLRRRSSSKRPSGGRPANVAEVRFEREARAKRWGGDVGQSLAVDVLAHLERDPPHVGVGERLGQAVVEPSVTTDPINFEDYTVSAQPGEQAERISISGTVSATGLVYDQTVVTEETTAFFRESLQSEVPDGYEIDPESVVLGEPLALAPAPDNVQFRVSAEATAYAVVDNGTLDDIRNDMSGSSLDEANARLDQVEQFETHDLSISPGWWFERMPKDSARIDIQVADPTAGGAESSPEATAED